MKPRVPYLTMRDIAALYGIRPSTARHWAQHDHWRHTSTRPRKYHAGDAQRSYDAHKHGRVTRHLMRRYGTVADDACATP